MASIVVPPTPAAASLYTVRAGDSWGSVGAANGISAQSLAAANGRDPSAPLPVGTSLEVPDTPGPRLSPVPSASGTVYLRADAATAWNELRQAATAQLGIDLYPGGPLSAHRTHEEQVDLWQRFQAGLGPRAAPPGTSSHERGVAVDLADPIMRRAIDLIGPQFGWRKVEAPDEWWHVNYVGG